MGIKRQIQTGPNFTPAYQTSGTPFVTSSALTDITTTPVQISFPYVTRFFVIHNQGDAALRIGFTANGVNDHPGGKHYFIIPSATGSSEPRYEIRCKDLFIRTHGDGETGGYSLLAGLTGISVDNFPTISGSNEFEGVG